MIHGPTPQVANRHVGDAATLNTELISVAPTPRSSSAAAG
eukprot:CAMPEP_0196680648 /NCGR_PEP_ID=MMETSP1090-20130531/7956_1 /TAXON_ID=37098 /ORGANISM="Isochrysis sp, Strain CCMP1244" /LENGTH=39 /DNA_ID= /DNA_START= /DNA_END= /DNA_ORIENTATION=